MNHQYTQSSSFSPFLSSSCLRNIALATVGLFATASSSLGQTMFRPLGALIGSMESTPFAISGDASTVVGASDGLAFRWQVGTGMIPLGLLPPPYNDGSVAYGVSYDGAVIVGVGADCGSEQCPRLPFRWEEASGIEPLLPITTGGIDGSYAWGASGDGSIIVGFWEGVGGFRWTRETGMTRLFPYCYEATAITPDGLVIVGTANFGSFRAFQWTAAGGRTDLGRLPGGNRSTAFGVSADGTTVVGGGDSTRTRNFTINEAFRWTASSGMVALGDFEGGPFESEAHGCSADGSIVIGWGSRQSSRDGFVWTQQHGMRDFKQVLLTEYSLGGELAGWGSLTCTGISADGRTIVGGGINPKQRHEAWMVYLDPPLLPLPCPADFNADGFTNSQDFFDYLTAFFTTPACPQPCPNPDLPCPADFNHDCLVNTTDFFDYLAAFLAGCP